MSPAAKELFPISTLAVFGSWVSSVNFQSSALTREGPVVSKLLMTLPQKNV